MATEKTWVWKYLLHPCLGSFLSNLDRIGSFLTCPQPPCGQGCCLFLESSRQQGAAGIKQLSLSCHGFWPTPAEAGISLQGTSRAILWHYLQIKPKGELSQLGGLRLAGMQGLGPKKTQAWLWQQMNTALMVLPQDNAGPYTALRSPSKAPVHKHISLLYSLCEFSFCGKTVPALLCLPEYRFLPGNHWKPEKIPHWEVRSHKEIASLQ